MFDTKKLIRTLGGIIAPQYFNKVKGEFEVLEGENGASNVILKGSNVPDAQALPVKIAGADSSGGAVNTNVKNSEIIQPIDIQAQLKEQPFSTTTALGAGATYTSPTYDSMASGSNFAWLTGKCFSNVAGTLHFEHSSDGTNWTRTRSIALTAGQGFTFDERIFLRYVRLVYVNGATAQTTFRLSGFASFF
jgi:hypothetical protein